MTESVASLQRMSSSKPPDPLTSIDTNNQLSINQDTEFKDTSRYEIEILSMITGIEMFIAAISIFVAIFLSQVDIVQSKVSYYCSIQSSPRMYNHDIYNIVTIVKEKGLCAAETITQLARAIKVKLIPIQGEATDISTIYKRPSNCAIVLNSVETDIDCAETILILIPQ